MANNKLLAGLASLALMTGCGVQQYNGGVQGRNYQVNSIPEKCRNPSRVEYIRDDNGVMCYDRFAAPDLKLTRMYQLGTLNCNGGVVEGKYSLFLDRDGFNTVVGSADSNGDGYVSTNEAYNLARATLRDYCRNQ